MCQGMIHSVFLRIGCGPSEKARTSTNRARHPDLSSGKVGQVDLISSLTLRRRAVRNLIWVVVYMHPRNKARVLIPVRVNPNCLSAYFL